MWDVRRGTKDKGTCVDSNQHPQGKHCHSALLILIFSTPRCAGGTALKERDCEQLCLLLGRSRWEKEVSRWFSTRRPSIWSTVFKGQIRSSFQACPRPILQIARACIRVFPFRFPPPIPHLLLMERAFQQQEKPTRSAPGEPVRLTIHKVLPSAQSKPTEGIEQLYLSVFLSNLWGYT